MHTRVNPEVGVGELEMRNQGNGLIRGLGVVISSKVEVPLTFEFGSWCLTLD